MPPSSALIAFFQGPSSPPVAPIELKAVRIRGPIRIYTMPSCAHIMPHCLLDVSYLGHDWTIELEHWVTRYVYHKGTQLAFDGAHFSCPNRAHPARLTSAQMAALIDYVSALIRPHQSPLSEPMKKNEGNDYSP